MTMCAECVLECVYMCSCVNVLSVYECRYLWLCVLSECVCGEGMCIISCSIIMELLGSNSACPVDDDNPSVIG